MKRFAPLAILAVLFLAAAAFAADHAMGEHHAGMDCAAMMAEQKAAQAKSTEMDAQLQKLVETMNKAAGEKKVDAMAAVITELVSQRTAMRCSMEKQQGEMMHHMAGHMAEGGKKMDCPMMKGGKAMDEKDCPMMKAKAEKKAAPAEKK